MINSKKYIILILLGSILILTFSVLWTDKHYMIFSILIIFLSLVPFFLKFERKELKAENTVLIAILASTAVLGRVPFAAIPSVQATSFVIIMTALSFGEETGFMVGSLGAFASNMFMGQGPWTIWQMFCWGMMGVSAGILRNTKFMKNIIGQSIFGFIWGFLFGWIMNIWYVLYFGADSFSFQVFLMSCITSFKVDLNHAISNVVFILLFSKSWKKIFDRVKIKYDL